LDRRDDISAEEASERLRRLEVAVDAMGLGLWEWDLRTGALTWNARNCELYGVDEAPRTIEDYRPLIHPEDRASASAAYRRANELGQGRDFELELRAAAAPEGQVRWLQLRGRVLRGADGEPERVVGCTQDASARKTAEERRSLVLRELAHRAKNGILVMMAIVGQTARGVSSVEEFEQVLTARLKSMAESQDLVTQAQGRALPMADLLARTLEPFDRGRFDIDERLTAVGVRNELVVAMALLLHELSTNAMKYGALSAPDGRVALALGDAGSGRAVLTWREMGGPPVKPAARRGFGSRLIEVSLRNDGGRVEGVFDPDGFKARIEFPAARGA
jgi:PAS domain S-box-containing protein